jgi:translocation and assembly module TamB
MSEPGAKSRWRRIRTYLFIAAIVALLFLGGFSWYATTDSFQALVRRRLVEKLEQVSGGRVDLASIHTVPFRFQVDIRNLTIHGREAADEIPYAHVDRLVARLKLISVLGAEVGFSSLVLEHPVIHILLYPDSTTNQPTPKVKQTPGKPPIEQLFALSIGELEVRRGELLWNDTKTPLDFLAYDVSADMSYSLLHDRYDGSLLLGKIDTKYQGYRPVAWTTEVHFILGPTTIEITSLKATSGRSRLQGSGKLVNFNQPNITAQYDLALDLSEASAVTHRRELRQGTLQARGNGAWTSSTFSSAGKIDLKNFEWRDESIGLHGAGLTSDYDLNEQRLVLSQLKAKLLGGEVSGNVQLANWQTGAPPTKGTKEKAANEQKGSASLRFKNLSASEIATVLSSAKRPLARMNLAGFASGSIDTQWRGSLRNADAAILLDVVAPSNVTSQQLPVKAHARGKYHAASGELEIAELEASTRATQVRASGRLSATTAMNIYVTTSDLREWQPVLADVGYQRIPVVLRGHASFNGTATGKFSAIAFAGKLQSEDFDVVLPPTAEAPQRDVHCDSLAADFQLSPHGFAAHNGKLQHGATTVTFDIGGTLQQRQFIDSSSVAGRLEMRNAEVDEVLALAGYDLPISGTANLSLRIAGTKAEPQGSGRIELSDAVIHGEPVQHLDAKLTANRDEISVTDLHLAYYDAHITGAGAYTFSSGAFHTSLQGDNFDLVRISQLQASRVAVEGRMDFTAQASGTIDQPTINAKIALRQLKLDHEVVGDYTFEAATQGTQLHVTGRSQFKTAELNIDSDIQMRGDWPTTTNLHFNHLDIDSLLRNYLNGRITGHSAMVGDVQLRGPLRRPRELEISGNLNDFFADVENIRVRNNGPIRFDVSNQFLKIQQFHLIGEGTDLTIGGTIRLNDEYGLDLSASGHANLQLIQSFNPDFTTSGEVAVDLTVGGTIRKPTTQGRLQVTNGSIAYSDLPSALSAINGSAVFNQDRLQIETMTAHVGGGLVSFGGYATAYNRHLNFDLTLQSQGVRLRYPPGVSSMADAELRWAGTSAASVMSGDVTVTKLSVTPGFDFGASLARSAQSTALPQTNPLLNRIRMDVHIVTTPELQMQTAVIRLSGDADLRLTGTLAKPVLLGRADVTEGEVYFNGTKYRMERGDVNFVNPVTTTPVLDLQASTHVRDYDITVNLNGGMDKLRLTYRSEPPLPEADIINLLALGQTQQQSAQLQQAGQSPFAQQASSAILTEALNSAISNRSRSLFGISHIRVDPQGMNTETSPTTSAPAVTIEQQVKDNLTLTYTTNVSQTSQQIIQAEYNVTRNVSILALRDYNGVISFEVRIRQRKK